MVAGVLLLVPAFFLGWATVGIPTGTRKYPVATMLVSMASLWATVLCLSTSWRLIANRSRPDGGLVSPLFLRGAAILFVAMPVFSLATGSWRTVRLNPAFVAFQTVLYIAMAITLVRLARRRETRPAVLPPPEFRERHDDGE